MNITINEIKIGDYISFKSISQFDKVDWRCKVIGFGEYSLVRNLQDVLPYYQNVKKTYPDMSPIDKLNYIILEVYENTLTTSGNKRIFAKEWIDVSSLKLINTNNYVDIRVFDIEPEKEQWLLDLISSNGYACGKIIK